MSKLTIINGLIQLPDDLTIEKERSILLYPTFEDNEEAINTFCSIWGKGKTTKTGAAGDSGVSVSTINRILKLAGIGQDYCDENGIEILKTNFKYVHKAAKKIKKAQKLASEKLVNIIHAQAEDGNFNAAKFLLQKINPEEYGDEKTQNSLDALNNINVTTNVQAISIPVLELNDDNMKKIERAQAKLYEHAHKLRNENKKLNENKALGKLND